MTPAPDLPKRVGTFAAGRYNAIQGTERSSLVKGYAAILIQVRNLPTSSPDPERDLLDDLSKLSTAHFPLIFLPNRPGVSHPTDEDTAAPPVL